MFVDFLAYTAVLNYLCKFFILSKTYTTRLLLLDLQVISAIQVQLQVI